MTDESTPDGEPMRQRLPFQNTIICDCYYGWPTQKRPRNERIRAVAQQIFNFTSSSSSASTAILNHNVPDRTADEPNENSSLVAEKKDSSGDGGSLSKSTDAVITTVIALDVIGHENDLLPLFDRLKVLMTQRKGKTEYWSMTWGGSDPFLPIPSMTQNGVVVFLRFLPGRSIRQCCAEHYERREISNDDASDRCDSDWRSHNCDERDVERHPEAVTADNITGHCDEQDTNDSSQKHPQLNQNTDPAIPPHESAIYLSPDSSFTLSPKNPPPPIVIVGMLIDRRVTLNRSLHQAERLHIQSYKLPMGELSLEGLQDSEPLNVDSVLEIMGAWWRNYNERIEVTLEGGCYESGDRDEVVERTFLDAGRRAMMIHQERHPGRILHSPAAEVMRDE